MTVSLNNNPVLQICCYTYRIQSCNCSCCLGNLVLSHWIPVHHLSVYQFCSQRADSCLFFSTLLPVPSYSFNSLRQNTEKYRLRTSTFSDICWSSEPVDYVSSNANCTCWPWLPLMLYFLRIGSKAASNTLLKTFLKSMMKRQRSRWSRSRVLLTDDSEVEYTTHIRFFSP